MTSMFNLGSFYENVEKDYELMKKYYLLAVERGDTDAICALANYFYRR